MKENFNSSQKDEKMKIRETKTKASEARCLLVLKEREKHTK